MALVVFMRGVNVGGHETFRPAALAKELVALDVVNVGAVNAAPRASYALLDAEANGYRIALHYVAYDTEAAKPVGPPPTIMTS